jgi:hypothetical protein
VSFGDGRDYQGAQLIYPGAHSPQAGFSGIAQAQALESLYYTGRFNSRLAFQQCFGFNFADSTLYDATAIGITTSGLTRVGEGFVYIPAEVTHLRAWIVFASFPETDSSNVATTPHHQIYIAGGNSGDETLGAEQLDNARSFVQGRVPGICYRAEVEMSLEGMTLEQSFEVVVTGFLGGPYSNSYRPFHVSCIMETRQT